MISGSSYKCCGCTACEKICPTAAISMVPNLKGFLEPRVDEAKCVGCGMCNQVCPIEDNIQASKNDYNQAYYASKRKNDKKRASSQSGGAFSALAEKVLLDNGVVFGVSLNSELEAEYSRIDNIRRLQELKGSKYVQASVSDTYRMAEKDLTNGMQVLFSGTPCHIQGLVNYLKKKRVDTSKLITVDLVCHGVPSPKVYADYKAMLEHRHKAKVREFNFRNKKFGWHGHVAVTTVGRKKYVNNDYVKFFYSHLGLRDSCYKCPYTNLNRPGDITVGDCWGIEKFSPKFDDNMGCSLVIINNEKGDSAWESVCNEFDIMKVKKDQILQPNLQHPTKKPEGVELFWQDYEKYGCEYALCRYCGCDPDDEYEIVERKQYFRRLQIKIGKIYNRLRLG